MVQTSSPHMRQSSGGISSGMLVVIAFVAFVALIAFIVGVSYVSAHNTGNRMVQNIVAASEDRENILSQYMQRVQEAAQLPKMQREDLVEVFTRANESRYGKTGSAATMQWIQEQNPNLDQATYLQIMRIIESGRVAFQTSQTRLVDMKRVYRTSLGTFWRGFWLNMAGHPTINVGYPAGSKDDYPIVSTENASDAVKSGKEKGPIQLR